MDVIGDGSTVDANANPIYDPYPTAFPAGGFDLEAVGAIHLPDPSLASGLTAGILFLLILGVPLRAVRSAFQPIPDLLGVTVLLAGPASALVATFENPGLGSESFANRSGLSEIFTSGGIAFQNSYVSPDDGFIIGDWTWGDLTGLGVIRESNFSFESSDLSGAFINTPTYLAADDLTTITEPGTALLLGLGLAGPARTARSRR